MTLFPLVTLPIAISITLQVLLVTVHSGSNVHRLCIANENAGNICASDKCRHDNISSLEVLPQLLQNRNGPHYIQLCTTNIVLNENIHFKQVYNVTLAGYEPKAKINCSNQAGITFSNSEGIYFVNLIVDRCGALQNSTSVDNTTSYNRFQSSLYLYNVTDFSMNNVEVSNSYGIGLALFDVDDLVRIDHCLFHNNSIANVNSDKVTGGGGMGKY